MKKEYIYTGLTILLVLGGIGYYAYSQGKKSTTIAPIPYDTGTGGGVQTNPENIPYLTQLATQIKEDIEGINLFVGHNTNLYVSALALSNTDFVALYNIFNTLFQSEFEETLTEMIEGEAAPELSDFAELFNAMLARLGSLNLP